MVIGKGANVGALRTKLNKLTGKQAHQHHRNQATLDLDAHLVGEGIAHNWSNVSLPSSHKNKQSNVQCVLEPKESKLAIRSFEWCRYCCAEGYSEGTVIISHTSCRYRLRLEEADTTYGKLGVKAWIYRGEVLPAR